MQFLSNIIYTWLDSLQCVLLYGKDQQSSWGSHCRIDRHDVPRVLASCSMGGHRKLYQLQPPSKHLGRGFHQTSRTRVWESLCRIQIECIQCDLEIISSDFYAPLGCQDLDIYLNLSHRFCRHRAYLQQNWERMKFYGPKQSLHTCSLLTWLSYCYVLYLPASLSSGQLFNRDP